MFLCQPLLEVLAERGIEDIDAFLKVPSWNDLLDPFSIPSMEKATARVLRGVREGERITIFGDYDCDGVVGAHILRSVLSALGAPGRTFLPHRDEGYGLSSSTVHRFSCSGTDLLLTVDNGINARAAVGLAQRLGIEVVVIDHHRIQEQAETTAVWSDAFCGAGPGRTVARPKGKKLHYIEPKLVVGNRLRDGIGYLKVAMFLGMVGVEVANEISSQVEQLGNIEHLIIDLRGNIGGGIGALRVMSLLTPKQIPVGFALDRKSAQQNVTGATNSFRRFNRIPASKNSLWLLALRYAPALVKKTPIVLETEALRDKPFHGRVVLLVDRHTASAAEMIVAFARENSLAIIVGEKTAGRLLSATSAKVGHGYRLALPTGAYYTWKGSVLEGTPIEPDKSVAFDWREARRGNDPQLKHSIELLEKTLTR